MLSKVRLLPLISALALVACDGAGRMDFSPRGDSDPARNGPGGDASNGPGEAPLAGRPGAPVVRLLGREELRNTLQDSLGLEVPLADLPLAALEPTLLASPPSDFMGLSDLTRWVDLTASLAQKFVAAQLSASPCAEQPGAVAPCVQALLASTAKRAFRRPVGGDELAAYSELYAQERARKGHPAGLELAVRALLLSPHFLYRTELGAEPDADGRRRLTSHELASAISYLITRSAPDAQLLAAADQGRLNDPAALEAEVLRLARTGRGKLGLQEFYSRWLEMQHFDTLEKGAAYGVFTPALRSAARAELAQMLEQEVFAPGGSFRNLFLSTRGFIDSSLASLYGVPAPSQPSSVELDPGTRRGILTRVAFLAANSKFDDSHPMHMGALVYERVLCQAMPPPPADALMQPFEPDPNKTWRENFEQRTSTGSCAGCHNVLNPTAFTFDGFDAVGRQRATRDGKPIDTSGSITISEDANGSFANLAGMMPQLASSAQVRRCHVTQWLSYALGRPLVALDKPSVEQLSLQFSTRQDVPQLLAAMVQSEAFQQRWTNP